MEQMETNEDIDIERGTASEIETEAKTATAEDTTAGERTTQTMMATGISAPGMEKTTTMTRNEENGTSGDITIGERRMNRTSSSLPNSKRNFPCQMKRLHKPRASPWSAMRG